MVAFHCEQIVEVFGIFRYEKSFLGHPALRESCVDRHPKISQEGYMSDFELAYGRHEFDNLFTLF